MSMTPPPSEAAAEEVNVDAFCLSEEDRQAVRTVATVWAAEKGRPDAVPLLEDKLYLGIRLLDQRRRAREEANP